MPVSLFAGIVFLLFLAAYFFYGRRIGRFFSLNDDNITPAKKFEDGFDFVPTSKTMLLAQHFASIAAAGPVVGPIVATLAFGWGPTLLWILLGCTLIGACHDFASLVASVRSEGKSIPEMAKAQLGGLGYRLLLAFIWVCLIYVIIAFTDVTAQQFTARETWGGGLHDVGGGVATSSLLYLGLSIVMGLCTTRAGVPLWLATLVFFPALIAVIYFGQRWPLIFHTANPALVWSVAILAYCAIASLLPMWILLQPRGYLGGYFLYVILIVGALGLLFGGFSIEYPMFKGFISSKGESLFPFLFITVACGACSGFHGLVCSGTTSRQLSQESHAPLVGYGGMLLEGVVAVMALTTVMIWPSSEAVLTRSPAEIYASGIARFSHAVFGLDLQWGLTFGMLAFATFVYDTLDVATRLGRYLVEELFQLSGWTGRLLATAATLLVPLLYIVFAPGLDSKEGTIPLWTAVWPLFGSSNQLLAALTLFLMALWMRGNKLPRWLFGPGLFMFLTSLVALGLQSWRAISELRRQGSTMAILNLSLSTALVIMGILFTYSCFVAARSRRPHSNGT